MNASWQRWKAARFFTRAFTFEGPTYEDHDDFPGDWPALEPIGDPDEAVGEVLVTLKMEEEGSDPRLVCW